MPLADYSHWNEEAPMIWWEEEGKHQDSSEPEYTEDDYDNPDFPFRDSTWDEDDTEKCTCTYGMPKHSLSRRGHNSCRDKRERWFTNHPASGFPKKHGRPRGRR